MNLVAIFFGVTLFQSILGKIKNFRLNFGFFFLVRDGTWVGLNFDFFASPGTARKVVT